MAEFILLYRRFESAGVRQIRALNTRVASQNKFRDTA
jgi:hypothetical protein